MDGHAAQPDTNANDPICDMDRMELPAVQLEPLNPFRGRKSLL